MAQVVEMLKHWNTPGFKDSQAFITHWVNSMHFLKMSPEAPSPFPTWMREHYNDMQVAASGFGDEFWKNASLEAIKTARGPTTSDQAAKQKQSYYIVEKIMSATKPQNDTATKSLSTLLRTMAEVPSECLDSFALKQMLMVKDVAEKTDLS